MRKNPGFIITLLAGMLSVTGLQAQNSGFYAVGGANLKYNDKELLFPKVQVLKRSDLENGIKVDQSNTDLGFSLDLGYMFTDKGKGPLRAIELGVEYQYSGVHYKDANVYLRENYMDYRIDIYDTRSNYLGARMSYIRRMYIGKGFIAEPMLTVAYGKRTSQEYRESDKDWFSKPEVVSLAFEFLPLTFEYRPEGNPHYGARVSIGSIRSARYRPYLEDAYKVLDVTLNRLSAALVYYF